MILNYAWGCQNGQAECFNTHNSNNPANWDVVGNQGNCNPELKPDCKATSSIRVRKRSNKFNFLHKNKNSMRNFMDFRSLTKDPVTGGLVVAGLIVGGMIGNKVAGKVKIPVLATKYPKVHKWVWIIGGAIAVGMVAKWGADQWAASRAPKTPVTDTTVTDTTPKTVELTVQ